MKIVDVIQIKRVNHTFDLFGYKISANRKASDGFCVGMVVQPSKVDDDFKEALKSVYGPNCFLIIITAAQHGEVGYQLDLSDRLTCDWLRNGKGWNVGPRPFKVEDFV